MANKAFDPVTYGAAVNAAEAAVNAAEAAVNAAEAARDTAIAQAALAQGYAAQLAAGIASPAGTYADLAALNAADPDHLRVYLTLDDGKWCYYDTGTSAFVAGGLYLENTFIPFTNMIRNGSFEGASVTTNSAAGTVEITEAAAKIGTYSLHIQAAENMTYAYYPNAQYATLYDNGDIIYVGAWVYIVEPLAGATLYVRVADSSKSQRSGVTYSQTALNQWQYNSMNIALNTGDELWIGRYNTDTAEFYADGVTMINLTRAFGAGNEPSALAMDYLLLQYSDVYYADSYTKTIINANVLALHRADCPDSQGALNLQKKCAQYATVKWTPVANMPKTLSSGRGSFTSGVEVTGIPYSSAKKVPKFIGYDVSLETFMTAVKNPESILYTRDLSDPEDPDYFESANAATYYGSVCSAFAGHASGVTQRYQTNLWSTVPSNVVVADQSAYGARVGDTLLNDGHVMMVSGILRNNIGRIVSITITEAWLPVVRSVEYSVSEFNALMTQTNPYVLYRYAGLYANPYTASQFVAVDDEILDAYVYNDVLMTDLGNKALYVLGTDTNINVMDGDALSLVVQKYVTDAWVTQATTAITDPAVVAYTNASCGEYRAYCTMDGADDSDAVAWSVGSITEGGPTPISPAVALVVNTDFTITYTCSENLTPLYLEWCGVSGGAVKVQPLETGEIPTTYVDGYGTATITTQYSDSDFHYRIFAGNEYGRITSPMRLVTLGSA